MLGESIRSSCYALQKKHTSHNLAFIYVNIHMLKGACTDLLQLIIFFFTSSPLTLFMHKLFHNFFLVKIMHHWKTCHLRVFIPLWSRHSSINYFNDAVSICTYSSWLYACAQGASVCSIHLVSSPLKGKKKRLGKKKELFSPELSTCVCCWVNRSCCHERRTACGLLFGIGFQVLSAPLILPQKAKRAINNPYPSRLLLRHDG